MPELGKATYRVVLDSSQFDRGMARVEARATQATNGIAKSMGVADSAIAGMGATAQGTAAQVGAAGEQMELAFEEAGVAAKAGAGQISAAAGSAAAASEAAAARTTAAWARSGAAIAGAGKRMRTIGRDLTMKVSLPVAAVGGLATKMSLDFNKSLTDISALVGATEKDIDSYRESILHLAREGPEGPKALAKALYFVTSSGFEGASAIKVLEASALASKAGLGEVATVADAVTSAVSAYGEETLSASRATDILVGTIREGKGEPEDLAQTIGNIVAPAQNLGIEFHELTGIMSAVSLVGTDFFESATQLRGIMAALIRPGKQAKEVFKAMGTNADQVRAAVRDKGLLAVLQQFRDHLKDQPELLAKIFPNIRAYTGLLSATGKVGKKTDQITRELATGVGDTAKAAEKAAKDNLVKLQTAWSRIQVAMISLGATLTPIVVKIANGIAILAEKFEALPGPVKTTLLVAIGLVAVLGPLLSIVGLMAIGIGGLVTVLLKIPAAMAAVRAASIALAASPMVGAFVAATAAATALLIVIGKVKSAMAEEEAAFEKTLSQQSQITDVFGTRYRQLRQRGMSDKEARAQAKKDAAAFAKRAGFDTSGGLFRPPKPKVDIPKIEVPKITAPPLDLDVPTMDDPTKKKKGKTKQPPALISPRIEMMMTKAERTKRLSDDLKAQEEALRYQKALLAKLSKRRGMNKRRAEIEQAITATMAEIASIKQEQADIQAQADQKIISAELLTAKIRIAQTKAERTEGLRDDIKAEQMALRRLKNLLADLPKKKKFADRRAELEEAITDSMLRIRDLKKQQKEAAEEISELDSAAWDALNERASFFGTFGSNVFTQQQLPGGVERTPGTGTPTFARGGTVPGLDGVPQMVIAHGGEMVLTESQVTGLASMLGMSNVLGQAALSKQSRIGKVEVIQNFQRPTTDRHREARYAKIATEAVFDGVGVER